MAYMKPISDLRKKFKNAAEAYKQFDKDKMRIAGTVGKNITKENFKLQGFDDGFGVRKWAKRSPLTDYIYDNDPKYKGSVFSSDNPILSQTGNLYNSVTFKVSGTNIVNIGCNLTVVPYAKLMNEGGYSKKFKAYIPSRPFIKPTRKITREIARGYQRKREQIFKAFQQSRPIGGSQSKYTTP